MPETASASASSGRRPRRRGRLARFTAALAVLTGLVGYVAVHYVTGGKGAPKCTVGSGANTYRFTPEQASNAATGTATTGGLDQGSTGAMEPGPDGGGGQAGAAGASGVDPGGAPGD